MSSVADKAIGALSAIPFHDLIGGPLNACIQAQSQAAMSTVSFIQSVGLTTTVDDKGNEKYDAVYVHFSFIQAGKKLNISVPLLTIVPIPYIAISTIDIAFKATVTGVDTTSDTSSESYEKSTNEEKKSGKLGWFKASSSKMTTSISSKRDSKSTQESSYSIESTIDVNVHAGQDSMPAGMAKVLELLNSAVSTSSPDGELTVSDTNLKITDKTVLLTASYKNPKGLLEPEKIVISPEPQAKNVNKTAGIMEYTISQANTYKISVTDKDNGSDVGTVEVVVKK
ncbi:MAG: DUF2589 domain-containing protein [Bacteroidales bacterium]|nr:DUF2589 domain-containing protein [Bacteroidales bacterium]